MVVGVDLEGRNALIGRGEVVFLMDRLETSESTQREKTGSQKGQGARATTPKQGAR